MNPHVDLGLSMLLFNDKYLLDHNVNERSITHKLGEYYQHIFQGWNVDCEFDRNLDGPKRIDIDPAVLLGQMADFLDRKSVSFSHEHEITFLRAAKVSERDVDFLRRELRNKENLVYDEEFDVISFVLRLGKGRKVVKPIAPDIIVHHRGTRDNFIVIEAKKSTNTNKRARLYDLVKLITLVHSPDFNYQFGYFIDIPAAHSGDALARHRKFTFKQSKLSPKVQTVTSVKSRA